MTSIMIVAPTIAMHVTTMHATFTLPIFKNSNIISLKLTSSKTKVYKSTPNHIRNEMDDPIFNRPKRMSQ